MSWSIKDELGLRHEFPSLPYYFDDSETSEDGRAKNHSQYRNSRTSNARRTVSQPDHDILEGLPIRRWQKRAVNVNTSTVEKADAAAKPSTANGYPEREMPKDWMMLSERCQAILLAARRGTLLRPKEDDEHGGTGSTKLDFADEDENPGLLTRKWALFSKDFEPPDREYLAKRRKGLRSLYGGSTVPMNTTGQMRKIKIRNVDSEGNSQVVEALVPEGQTVDAEIVEEELTSPTQALAPGTKVEGVGIANAEGVLVPEELVTPSAQRRRPPPPKRRNKGPGRGRKKKVAFAAGANGSTTSAPIQVADGTTPKIEESNGTNGVQSATGDHDREDSIMQDGGQDGDEGSEDGSEVEDGEDGQKEEGEISATPEADDSRGQSISKTQSQNNTSRDTGLPEPPTLPKLEAHATEERMLDQPAQENKNLKLDQVNDSTKEKRLESSATVAVVPLEDSENASVVITSVSESSADAKPASHPVPLAEPTTQSILDSPTVSTQTGRIRGGHMSDAEASGSQTEQSLEVMSEQDIPPPVAAGAATSEASTSIVQDTVSVNQESPPPHAMTVDLSEPLVPSSESQTPHPPPLQSAGNLPGLTTTLTAGTNTREEHETSQPSPLESNPAKTRRHTPHAPSPEAPTPSPPTPLPTSFDPHQRGRLMGSPRAPTMSPPTPARDLSSSPDLPLAGHRELAPLTIDKSAPETSGKEGHLNGAATSHPPIPHAKESEHPARFPDGEEDLLGSLERSLEK